MPQRVQSPQHEPLLSPQQSPLKQHYAPIYVLLALIILASMGNAIITEAVTDAQYLIICRYKGIDADKCFTEPIASDLEGVLSGYLNIADSIWGILAMLVIATSMQKFGMRAVCIGFLAIGTLGAVGFSSLLNGPAVNYMLALIPAMLSNAGFSGVGSFFGAIYISEAVTDVNMRTTFIGWNTAADSLVRILGPSLGAYFMRTLGISRLFLVSAVFNCVSVVAIWLFMKEIPKVEAEKQPSIVDSLKLACGLKEPDQERRRSIQKANAFVIITGIVLGVIEALSKIYVKAKFGWSASENGYLKSVSSAIKMFSVTVLSPMVLLKLSSIYSRHPTEVDIVDKLMSYLFLSIASLALFVLAAYPSPSTYFVATSLECFRGIGQPSLIAMALKLTPSDAITSFWLGFSYLTMLVSIPVMTIALKLYRHSLRVFPESYLWASFAAFVGCAVLLHTLKTHKPISLD